MSDKRILIATCKCGEKVHMTTKELGQKLSSARVNKPSTDFMKEISKKGVEARKLRT